MLDDAGYDYDGTATAGSLAFASPNLTWTGDLAAGASATITFSVTVNNPDTGNKSLASTITSATAGSNCASGSTDARCASTVTVLVPGLTTTVSAGASTTTPGSVVTFTVTVTNSGQTAYTGAAFTDPLSGLLDDASYDGDAAATAGSLSFASPDLTWTGNLAVGASATITFSVTVKNPDTGDKILVDTVSSATPGSNCPAGSTDARCAFTVSVLVPGLEIAASAGSGSTAPGSVVQFTVTVTNSGQTAYTGAAFTDPLSGVLDDASYDGDAAATAGSVSFSSPDLTWTGNLAVGAAATITFSVTVNSPDTGNKILASTITSATPGSNCAAGSVDPPCTLTVPVAVLTIVNGSNVTSTTPGSVVRFTATFTNAGQVPYTGITVASDITDVLDDATPNGDQTATSGALTLTSTGISWTGSIAVGGTVTVTGTVTVNNPDTGNKLMASTLSTAAAGSNCPAGGTDPRCSISVPVLIPALSIVKTADTTSAVPGQVIGFTVTITNTGPVPYPGATVTDSFAGMLDDAAYDGDAAATIGTLAYTSPTLTWTGSLAPGAAAVITYTVTVSNPDTGDKLVINTVTSAATGSTCPPGSTGGACRVTVPVLTPALTIATAAATTSGSNAVATPGGVVTYTITVTNTGQTPYSGAGFTDPLSGVLEDAAYNNDAAASAGTVSYTSPTLAWAGDLAPGAAAVITYSVTVNNPDIGNLSLTNTVTSATPGSNCPAGGGDARCTVTVTVTGASTLTFSQTAAAASTVAGQVVHYTITIANSGASPYTGASFTDPLTGVLDDAAYDDDAVAVVTGTSTAAGTVSFTSPTLAWAGDVPAVGSVTLTYTVTVNNPDTGNMILASTITSPSSGGNCPAAGPGPACTATVTVSQLAISTTPSAATTTPGAVLRFTTTMVNTGQTPYYGISVSFTGADVASNATSNGDQTASSGTLSVGAAALWTGDIPVGGTVTITGSLTIDNPDTGDHIIAITDVSTAPGNNCPAGSTDPACSPSVPVLTPALTITQTADATTAVPGQTVTYTVTVANTGQTPYTGAAVTDTLKDLDDAVYNGDAAPTAGSVSYASPVLTWTGDLAAGATVTITFTVTVDNPDTGDKLLLTTVASADTGSSCPPASSGPGCDLTVPVLTPALTITTTASAGHRGAGAGGHLHGHRDRLRPDPLYRRAVHRPAGRDARRRRLQRRRSATTGTVSFTSPDLTWTGNLAAGAAATVTYTVTVSQPDTGDHILTTTITSATPGSNCAAGVHRPPLHHHHRRRDPDHRQRREREHHHPRIHDRLHPHHHQHRADRYDGATVTDPLTGVTDDGVAFGDDAATTAGSVSYVSPDLTWTGDLAPGQAATVTFTVTVDNPDTGDKTITSTLTSTDPGSTCPPSGPAPACTSTVTVLIPALTITKTASTTTTTPGSAVGYTITVTDTGPTPYTAATVTDALDGVLDDAAYNNDATATSRHRHLHQPRPDLDRRPGPRPGRHHHLHRHRQQPRHRRQAPDQHRHLHRPRAAPARPAAPAPPAPPPSPC